MPARVVVGVAGGSASGKSEVVDRLAGRLGDGRVAIVSHDAYYHDLSHLPLAERRRVNVDHPDSLETELLEEHLEALVGGEAVQVPIYDYSLHVRLEKSRLVEPAPVLLVEGILVLAESRLRELMDLKVYVHAPEAERLARRLDRDVRLRGRTPESVREDHHRRVEPMHQEFVEPSRAHADLVIHGGGHNVEAIRSLADRIHGMLD